MDSPLLDKNQNRIGSMFNRIAHVYDFLNHLLSAGFDIYWRRRATKALNKALVKRTGIVADIATGTGDLGLSLLSSNDSITVVGVDIASKMLIRAQNKIKNRSLERRFSIILGSALTLPLKNNSCDGVMIAYGIRNIPDIKTALSEFSRVLKHKGHILILEFGIPNNFLFRKIYLFYFQRILPRLGRIISGDNEAYLYLPVSVKNFISPDQMKDYLEAHGFEIVETNLFLWGVSYYVLAKFHGDVVDD